MSYRNVLRMHVRNYIGTYLDFMGTCSVRYKKIQNIIGMCSECYRTRHLLHIIYYHVCPLLLMFVMQCGDLAAELTTSQPDQTLWFFIAIIIMPDTVVVINATAWGWVRYALHTDTTRKSNISLILSCFTRKFSSQSLPAVRLVHTDKKILDLIYSVVLSLYYVHIFNFTLFLSFSFLCRVYPKPPRGYYHGTKRIYLNCTLPLPEMWRVKSMQWQGTGEMLSGVLKLEITSF